MLVTLVKRSLYYPPHLQATHCLPCLTRKCISSLKGQAVAVERLNDRSLLRVSGNDSSAFLQGMITNDMRHLQEGAPSMFSMFLNVKGRVMCDSIIYRTNEDNAFLIECDKEALPMVQKHLKMYRLRKKVDVDNIENDYKVWVIFNTDVNNVDDDKDINSSLLGHVLCSPGSAASTNPTVQQLKDVTKSLVTRDPRLSALGIRIVAPSESNVAVILRSDSTLHEKAPTYRSLRYTLGVGEGVVDLPPGKCFPLEVNCDYLHGVSFHKGCYLGQELTARTHHTGVVRKRLMPLLFTSSLETSQFVPVENESGKSVGKIHGIESNVGLGLLRIAEALQASSLKVSDVPVKTQKPSWWPKPAPKERIQPN